MHKLKTVAGVHTHTHTHTSRNLREEKRVVKNYSKNNGINNLKKIFIRINLF